MNDASENKQLATALQKLVADRAADYVELELSGSSAETVRDFDSSVEELRKVALTAGLDLSRRGEIFRGAAPDAILHGLLSTVPLAGAAVGFLVRGWIDSRNGRKLKIRVGEIEVDATQLNEAEVLRICEVLQKRSEQMQIRSTSIDPSQTS